MLVLYNICPLFLGYIDELDVDPFLPVWQHDAAVIGRQLQGQRAEQAVTPFGDYWLSSEDDETHRGRRLGSLLGRYRFAGKQTETWYPQTDTSIRVHAFIELSSDIYND